MATIIDAIRDHLAAQGIVRLPDDAGGEPPLWRAPPDGTPAPGSKTGNEADDGLVMAIYLSGEIPPDAGAGYSNRLTFDVDFRSKRMESIEDAAEQIRGEFAPANGAIDGGGIPGIRFNWTLESVPAVQVIESRLWRGLQALSMSRAEGYHYRLSLLLETYR